MHTEFSGCRLRELRTTAGLTREVLAVAIGRTLNALAAWEQCRKVPDAATLGRLCDALGCTPGDLFVTDGVGEPTLLATTG